MAKVLELQLQPQSFQWSFMVEPIMYWSVLSCVLLCNSSDCSPPASSVHGIFQARILEWVAIPSFRGSSHPTDQTLIPCIFCIAVDSQKYEGLWWTKLGLISTGMGCHSLLQRIFPTHGSNPHLLHLLHCGCYQKYEGLWCTRLEPHSISCGLYEEYPTMISRSKMFRIR